MAAPRHIIMSQTGLGQLSSPTSTQGRCNLVRIQDQSRARPMDPVSPFMTCHEFVRPRLPASGCQQGHGGGMGVLQGQKGTSCFL